MLLPEVESLGSWRKAAELGITHSIVSRLWRQFQTTGAAIRGFSSGRPRGTTPVDDRYIVLQARINLKASALHKETFCFENLVNFRFAGTNLAKQAL
ncbi:transposable element Tc1 transposase [Trichonephila clavipes]|nr:transposable element Tc1 transposase [Trichonephila clavipes]